MVTHYNVLGVSQTASYDEVRRAYLDRARAVHPDRVVGGSSTDAELRERSMQEVNEAWRVLRDPASRMAYDHALARGRRQPRAAVRPPAHGADPPKAPRHLQEDDDYLDVPYRSAPAQPGDLGVSVARALPWLTVTLVLLVIFVFTAFAGGGKDTPAGPRDLLNKCVSSGRASAIVPVPCQGPNDGEVVLVVDRASLCPDGSSSRAVAGDLWLCLQPFHPTAGRPANTSGR